MASRGDPWRVVLLSGQQLGLSSRGAISRKLRHPPTTQLDVPHNIAPFVQTPEDVVDRMLALADVRAGDVLYDLGSGDGRVVMAAARTYGITAVGFEIDPDLVFYLWRV